MDLLTEVSKLFATWENFVVTLDNHPIGATIFLMLIALICYAILRLKA